MSDEQNISKNVDETDEVTDENLDQVIRELDSEIAGTDPNFLEELNSLNINNSNVAQSLSDTDTITITDNIYFEHKTTLEKIKELFDFKYNFKKVTLFWLVIIAISIGAIGLIKMNSWTVEKSPYLTSFAEWNNQIIDYNPNSETQSFFENPRMTKNIIELKKMTVNIRPSINSGSNPMLAFELNIEGDSREVVVEIKDREAEFLDLILRIAEGFSYDELEEARGKQQMSEQILDGINTQLSRGQIRKVYYASIILKP